MEDRGLIIGIEYDKSVVQACVYDMKNNIPAACDNVKGLSLYDAVMQMKNIYHVNTVDCLCVTTGIYEKDTLDEISNQIYRLGISEGNYIITGYVSSFAYYAYSQRKELYKSGVVLMDYDGECVNIQRLS